MGTRPGYPKPGVCFRGEEKGSTGLGYGARRRGGTQEWVITLASAGQMLARRSQTVLGGMQPAERITSGRAWEQVVWPVSPQTPLCYGRLSTSYLEATAYSKEDGQAV